MSIKKLLHGIIAVISLTSSASFATTVVCPSTAAIQKVGLNAGMVDPDNSYTWLAGVNTEQTYDTEYLWNFFITTDKTNTTTPAANDEDVVRVASTILNTLGDPIKKSSDEDGMARCIYPTNITGVYAAALAITRPCLNDKLKMMHAMQKLHW